MEEAQANVRLKSACLEAFSHVAHLPKEEQESALDEHKYLENIKQWRLAMEDDARDTCAAKQLMDIWTGKWEAHSEFDGWWEVRMQETVPQDGPVIKVELVQEVPWTTGKVCEERWITGMKFADKSGQDAHVLRPWSSSRRLDSVGNCQAIGVRRSDLMMKRSSGMTAFIVKNYQRVATTHYSQVEARDRSYFGHVSFLVVTLKSLDHESGPLEF